MSEVCVKEEREGPRTRITLETLKAKTLAERGGKTVFELYLSWLWCRAHLWRWRGGKNEGGGLSRTIGGLETERMEDQNRCDWTLIYPNQSIIFGFYKVSYSHLCQSRGRGRNWDRRGSRYRLWWFVHFTFFYGSALGWPCVASFWERVEQERKK